MGAPGRDESDEAAGELRGGEDEDGAATGAVLVVAVVASGEALEGKRPPAAVAAEALEAFPVVGVDPGVGVEAEALEDGEATAPAGLAVLEGEAVLHRLGPQGVERILGPVLREVREVLRQLEQHPAEDCVHLLRVRGGERHLHSLGVPQRLGEEDVQVRVQLQGGAEVLGEGHRAAEQLSVRAQAASRRPLPAPHRRHQAPLHLSQESGVLHHPEAKLEGQGEGPLPEADLR